MTTETTEQRRARITRQTMLKIAEHQIKRFGLSCTPEEYVKRCQENTVAREAGLPEPHKA